MSGATYRREDEHVPDEKFAVWETDVRLWQVEFKLEDRDRLGPRLYRRGLNGQPQIIVKTKLETQDVSEFTVDNQHHSMPQKTTVMENFLKSLDKRHWKNIST